MNRRKFLKLSTLAAAATVVPFKPLAKAAIVVPSDKFTYQPVQSIAMRAGETIRRGELVEILNNRLFVASARSRLAGVAISSAEIGQPVIVLTQGIAKVLTSNQSLQGSVSLTDGKLTLSRRPDQL